MGEEPILQAPLEAETGLVVFLLLVLGSDGPVAPELESPPVLSRGRGSLDLGGQQKGGGDDDPVHCGFSFMMH